VELINCKKYIKMVKSSSRPQKPSKFVVDLGPGIDRIVKKTLEKKDAKIKKQKLIILALRSMGTKVDDTKVVISGLERERIQLRNDKEKLQEQLIMLQKVNIEMENKFRTLEARGDSLESIYNRQRASNAGIRSVALNNAFKNLRNGYSLSRMQPRTKSIIQQAGRWDEALALSKRTAQMKLC
tara:strand:+ start:557 stop:1105 length:549 start_codon:yes stop_codon:yes gene_type:complete